MHQARLSCWREHYISGSCPAAGPCRTAAARLLLPGLLLLAGLPLQHHAAARNPLDASSSSSADLLQPAPSTTATPPRRCGSHCSHGVVGPFLGPIDTAPQLASALRALSFHREIIISHHHLPDHVLQFVQRWNRFGYGHILLVLGEEALCHKLARAFPRLGCGWYSDAAHVAWVVKREVPNRGWLEKWLAHLTAARSVRAGYSTMVIDTDSAPLHDLYRFMALPPHANITYWGQREGHFNLNGGFYYVRNAAPAGPAAWALCDHVLKNVRWYEDSVPLRVALGHPPNHTAGLADQYLCFDQFSLSDSLHATITGIPQVYECGFWFHTNRSQLEAAHLARYRSTGAQGAGRNEGPYETWPGVKVPRELRRGAGGAATGELHTGVMRMPHYRGAYPGEFLGYPFAREPGALTRYTIKLLQDSGLGWFPDAADPSSAPAADAVPTELFAYLPAWIENTHMQGPANAGVAGWYNEHLTGEAPAAVTHLHAGLMLGDFPKEVHCAVGLAGGWDLDLMARAFAPADPYIATQHLHHLPPLLALAPGVVHAGLTLAQLGRMMQGLARAAIALGRAVAWPWVPCEAPLARRDKATYDPRVAGRHKIPWDDYLNTSLALPYGPGATTLELPHAPGAAGAGAGAAAGGGAASAAPLRCLLTVFQKAHCLRGGLRLGAPASAPRGLLPYEFDHWLAKRAVLNASEVRPGPANTLSELLAGMEGMPMVAGAEAAAAPPLALLAAHLAALRSRAPGGGVPLLWLDVAVSVPELGPEKEKLYARMAERCCALMEEPSTQCLGANHP